MGGNFSNNIYYRRKINPGDTTIEGRASNGLTLDNTGNVFLYSSQNQTVLNQLISSSYTGSVEISPNTDNSFIGIISTSTDSLISKSPISLDMGSTNYTTFNLENQPSNYIQPSTPLTPSTTPSEDPLKFIHNPADNSTIFSPYGMRNGRLHKGVDITMSVGSNLYAVWDGIVVTVGNNIDPNGYGNVLIIKHSNEDKMTLYGHVNQFNVTVGQTVNAGDIVAFSGGAAGAVGAGNSTGPHLHFEVREGTVDSYNPYFSLTPEDPAPYFIGYIPDLPSGEDDQEPLEDIGIILPPPQIEEDTESLIRFNLPEDEGEVFPLPDEYYPQFIFQSNLAESQDNTTQTTTTPSSNTSGYYSGTYLGYPIIKNYEDFQTIDPEFYNKVKQVAREIGLADYTALFKVMKHETGGTFSPAITNGVGYYGLIQLNKNSIQKYGYTINEYTSMSRTRQMDEVKRYFLYWKNTLGLSSYKPVDLYVALFWPAGVGKPDSYVLQTSNLSAQTVAEANPSFNKRLGRPKDEALTIGKLKQYYNLTGML